jgi:hypothetical protein
MQPMLKPCLEPSMEPCRALALASRPKSLAVWVAILMAACSSDDDGDGTSTEVDAERDGGRRDVSRDVASGQDTDETGGDSATTDTGDVPGSDADASVDVGVGPTVAEVDPGCVDGQYREVPPDPLVSLASELDNYSAAGLVDFIHAVLQKRYPIGDFIFQGGIDNPDFFHCLDDFIDQTSSAEAVILQLSTVVHECGHALDFAESLIDTAAYVITPELSFECSGGSSAETFARSLLNGDDYAALRPGCDCCGQGCDFYATLYLDGDPQDGTFDSGDQGFDSVLEEAAQYVNSLATAYAFNEFVTNMVSERDGILTFLWYIERYLHLARLEHPDTYAVLSEDSCWREAILTVWGRAWLMLELTEDLPQLALDDDALLELVRDPDLLAEIALLRTAAACP